MRKENRRNDNEWTLKKVTVAIALITLFITIFGLVNHYYKNNIKKSIKMYDSKILKVDELDAIDPNRANTKKDEEDYFFLAGKDQILIDNKTDNNILVDQVEINFLESSKFYYSDILLLQGIKDDRLIFYMVNNGNKDSTEQSFQFKASLSERSNKRLIPRDLSDDEIKQTMKEESKQKIKLKGGDIKKVYEFSLGEELKKMFEDNSNLLGIDFSLNEMNAKKEFRVYSIIYDRNTGSFTYGGLGGASLPKEYRIIDVSPGMEGKISFDGVDTYIDNNSMGTVEVIFLAKESVTLKFKNTIIIKGEKIRDEKIKNINIAVPWYDIPSDAPNQKIFNLLSEHELSEYNYNENIQVKDSIKYNPSKALNLIKQIE